MIEGSAHAGFILAAYLLAAAVLIGVVAVDRRRRPHPAPPHRRPRGAGRAPPFGGEGGHDHDQRTTPAARRPRLVFLLPLAVFVALAAVFLIRLETGGDPEAIPSALVGKPAPDFRPAAARRASAQRRAQEDRPRRPSHAWSTSSPRGAVPAGSSTRSSSRSPRTAASGWSASITRTCRPTPCASSTSSAIPMPRSASTRKGRAAIDWGVYGVPETFIVDAERHHPPQAHRPDQRGRAGEGAEAGDREGPRREVKCRVGKAKRAHASIAALGNAWARFALPTLQSRRRGVMATFFQSLTGVVIVAVAIVLVLGIVNMMRGDVAQPVADADALARDPPVRRASS